MSERVAAIYVGKANAELVIGRSWRNVQDIARQRGVQPRRVGRITLYNVDELRAAIEGAVSTEPDTASADDAEIDDLEALRRKLGKRRRR